MVNFGMWSTSVKLLSCNGELLKGEVTLYRKLRYIEITLYRDSNVMRFDSLAQLNIPFKQIFVSLIEKQQNETNSILTPHRKAIFVCLLDK